MDRDLPALRDRTIPLAIRCRLSFVAGVVDAWTGAHGRPPSEDELERLLERYPGDPDAIAQRHEVKRAAYHLEHSF